MSPTKGSNHTLEAKAKMMGNQNARKAPTDVIDTTKICPRCVLPKDVNDFYLKDWGTGIKPWGYCKPCAKEIRDERKVQFPDEAVDNYLRYKYNMTIEEYREQLALQHGVCAICHGTETHIDRRTNKLRALAVDHNHKTGKRRALLCSSCNKAIGELKDDPEIMRAAADYIEAWNEE